MFVTLGDLVDYIRDFAMKKKLFLEERGYSKFGWKKLAIFESKPGEYLKEEFSKKHHIAIYETKFLFDSSERLLIVVSLDFPKGSQSIDECDQIGNNGKLIGAVISRKSGCKKVVWEELEELLSKAIIELQKISLNGKTL